MDDERIGIAMEKEPKKRGRHKKECACVKCTARKAKSLTETAEFCS